MFLSPKIHGLKLEHTIIFGPFVSLGPQDGATGSVHTFNTTQHTAEHVSAQHGEGTTWTVETFLIDLLVHGEH